MTLGAYFVTNDKTDINIMSSGADVQIALELKEELKRENINANVISMLSLEVFENQPNKIKSKFMNKPLFVVETSTCVKYLKYTDERKIFNITKYGISGDSASLKAYYGFDLKTLVSKIKKEIK